MNNWIVKPTPRKAYLLAPAACALMGGAGAALVAAANQFPPEAVSANGFGWGLIFGATALTAAIGAIGNERRAYFESLRPGAQPVQELPRQTARPEKSAPVFLYDSQSGAGVRGDFLSLSAEQSREMARRVAGGDYALAYNRLRALPPAPGEKQIADKTITAFRQELRDRGFAAERGRGEMTLTGEGKRHFYRLHAFYARKPLPRSAPAWRATAV